jgi:hypothetical protein
MKTMNWDTATVFTAQSVALEQAVEAIAGGVARPRAPTRRSASIPGSGRLSS